MARGKGRRRGDVDFVFDFDAIPDEGVISRPQVAELLGVSNSSSMLKILARYGVKTAQKAGCHDFYLAKDVRRMLIERAAEKAAEKERAEKKKARLELPFSAAMHGECTLKDKVAKLEALVQGLMRELAVSEEYLKFEA